MCDLVTAVAAILDPAGIPGARHGVDRVVAGLLLGLEPHVVEHVELGFGAKYAVSPIPVEAVVLRFTGNVARVAAVRLLGQRVVNEEVIGLRRPERV